MDCPISLHFYRDDDDHDHKDNDDGEHHDDDDNDAYLDFYGNNDNDGDDTATLLDNTFLTNLSIIIYDDNR